MKPASDPSAELAHVSEHQLAAPQPAQAPSLVSMMQAVITGGVTTENVGVLKEMLAIHERMEVRDAEKKFNAAFSALQNDLPVIVAESIIPNRGKYARFENVMHQISPMLSEHGFSVSFSQENDGVRVIEKCTLRHIAGHSQTNSFSLRISGKSDSETQADAKASTTAKRNALLNCLNIVVRQDVLLDEEGSAEIEGEVIQPGQALWLREQIVAIGSSENVYLKLAGVDSLDKVRSGAFPVLVRAIEERKKANAAKATQKP